MHATQNRIDPSRSTTERLEWKLKGHLQSDIKEEEEEVSAVESS